MDEAAGWRTAQSISIERPYAGQLWTHDGIRVMIVAVTATTVTFEELSGAKGTTRVSHADFLACYKRLRR
jgi:hypothetical protein